MAASLDDILTAQKNGVIALNSIYHTMLNQDGMLNALEISSPTLVQLGPSKLADVVVIVAGSTVGYIYDAGTVAAAVTGKRAFVIPNTVGMLQASFPFQNGIVVIPGSGQIVSISYS